MHQRAILITTAAITFLAGCADPASNDENLRVKDVSPKQTAMRTYARKYEITRDSRIGILNPDGQPKASFSRYQGVLHVNSENGQLASRNHRFVIDTRSAVNTKNTNLKAKGSPYLTIFIENVSPIQPLGTYKCTAQVEFGGRKRECTFEAKTEVNEADLRFTGQIKGISHLFTNSSSEAFGESDTLEIVAIGRPTSNKPELMRIPRTESDFSSTYQRPIAPKPTEPDKLKDQFSWRAAKPNSKQEKINGLLTRFDDNKDKKVSRKEAGDFWSSLEDGDVNGDGVLTKEELDTLRIEIQTVGE